MDKESSAEYKTVWKTLAIIFTILAGVIIAVLFLTSCQYLGLDPKAELDDEISIGVKKHHVVDEKK